VETRASYAAVVADRWLWVAAAEPLQVSLEGATVPVVVDDSQPGHVGVRLDLAALPDGEGRHAVLAGGRPLLGPAPAPSGPGTTHALERDGHDHLHVIRRVRAEGVTLRSVRLVADSVELRLDAPGTAPLELRDGDLVVARVQPDEGRWTITPAHLVDASPGRALRAWVDGRPVVRRANTLADPGAGALLPAVHPVGAADPVARLRWAPDAALVVRMVEP
jgi:hypothetical protein